MAEKQRVLFVDDQPNVLDGLRRVLHKFRHEWDMEYAVSGAEALAAMEKRPFDIIVADMKMPVMNGAQLLKRVSELYPSTVRFILSGHSDRELILQSVGYAHQYLSKPCEPETLRQLVRNSIGLRTLLSSRELQSKINAISSLPSLPETYNKLVAALQSEESSVKEVAEIISQDVGMTAKLLQMINSAFFGLPTHVESILHAVGLLGFETVQGLVLVAGVFNQYENPGLPGISIEAIYSHSIAVGKATKDIAGALGLNKRQTEDALMAGMLHDVGKLIMLVHFRSEYGEAIQLAEQKSIPLPEAERQILGVTHGEVGAHLLSLWGLPDSIIEAVALHHSPLRSPSPMLSVLTAVHIANALDHEQSDGDEQISTMDAEYLTQLNIADQVPELRERFLVETA